MADGSAFGRDTVVEPVGPGQYVGHATPHWCGLMGQPLGGYVLAIALRALAQELPSPDPLVVSASFLSRVGVGPVELRTERVRAGRRTATGEVRLYQGGREAMRAMATFGDFAAATGPTGLFASPPTLPPPEEAIDLYGPDAPVGTTVARQLAFKVARLPGWRTGAPSGEPSSEFWMRLTGGGEDDPMTLPFLVDAAAPAVVELGAVGSTTLQLTVHIRRRPAPGWLACRTSTRFLVDGYHEEDFEIWNRDGELLAQSRQLALMHEPT